LFALPVYLVCFLVENG